MKRVLAAATLFIVLGLGQVSEACINEPDLPHQEQEFRSRYKRQRQQQEPRSSFTSPVQAFAGFGLSALGLAVVGGSLVVAARRPRS